ncbi:MAG: YciI family protein [Micavibrio sp.]
MPQFIVIGRDGTDEGAPERRMAARDAHLQLCAQSVESGNQLIGAAMTDEAGKMNGSCMIMDFESRQALEEWLKREPYIAGKVWESVEIIPCKVPDTFAHCFPRK